MLNKYKRLAWFDPARKSHLNLVYWKMGLEYIRTVNRADIPLRERWLCYRSIAHWYYRRRRLLVDDLKASAVQLLPFSQNIVHIARKFLGREKTSGGGI